MRGTNYSRKNEKYCTRTFEEGAIKYLFEFRGETLQRQQDALSRVEPYIGDMLISDVDNDALQVFKTDRLAGAGHCIRFKPASAGTVNKEINTVTTVLRKACKVWRWTYEPALLERVVGPSRRAYPYTWEEQDELFSHFPHKWAYGAAMFAVNTGVRMGELIKLEWKDLHEIDSLNSYIFLLRDTKNGKDRAVICNSLAMKYVDEQKDNRSRFVFPKQVIGLDNSVWRDCWHKARMTNDPLIAKGGHNCRHTFGYRLRAFGVPQEDRDELLGHHNSNITQHYAQPHLPSLVSGAETVATGYQEKREIIMLRSV